MTKNPEPNAARVRLITLDPGHFHAALVQKFMYADVDPLVHVYAPAGDELNEHLKRIERFNRQAEQPTDWRQQVYAGADFLEKMLADKMGNVVVLAGNNARKTEYILRSIEAGFHVLADKPMVITPGEFPKLKRAFAMAASKGLLLYDIMTERHEITTMLQRELSQQAALFGELVPGSPENPAITKESMHHLSKLVAGVPLKRPQWFFDVRQEGDGTADVMTHLVDMVQWEAFPEQVMNPSDVTVLNARRWPTAVTHAQFQKVTGAAEYPEYLRCDVKDDVLQVYCNAEINYRLRGIHAKVSAAWNFEAPPGGGDTHYSIMRGTKANLVIRQGAEQKFKPVLYVEKAGNTGDEEFEMALRTAIKTITVKHPGIDIARHEQRWRVVVPDKYEIGHEAHFAQVTATFLRYLRDGRLPDWEVPNMISKYSTMMKAHELSR